MKYLKKIILIIFFVYIFINVTMYFIQENLIFFPEKKTQIKDEVKNEVVLKTKDNVKIYGKFLKNNSEKVVLFFHGNAGNIYEKEIEWYEVNFKNLDYSVLFFDYRGYGKSDGKIKSENDLFLDSLAAYLFLKKEGYNDNDIILWGHSLGAAVALDFNSKINKKFDALVLDSIFDSMLSLANKEYPYIFNNLLLKYKFENDKKIQKIKNKILFIHGENDQVIDKKYSKKLFNLFDKEKKYILTIGYHNSSLFNNDYEKNILKIKKFLEK